jgi:hypothetical protein
MRGNQKVFTTMAVSALVVMFLFSAPTTARAVTTNLTAGQSINLATVIDNGLSVWIGDKVFGDFFFNYSDLLGSPDVALAASNVNVRALSNDIGFGLEFLEPLIAVNDRMKDITFEYTAAVTNSSNLISDIHLSITGSANNGGIGTVGENVFSNGFGGTVVGHIENSLPGGPLSSATNIVPAVTKLWVTKDVMVYGGFNGPTSFATITVIDQTFSQIPEPSTVLLVGLGLLGAVALKRKS